MDNEEVLARHWHLGTTAMLISIALQVSLTFHNLKIGHHLVFFCSSCVPIFHVLQNPIEHSCIHLHVVPMQYIGITLFMQNYM